jgi:hypothetical protein
MNLREYFQFPMMSRGYCPKLYEMSTFRNAAYCRILGAYIGSYEELYIPGYKAAESVENLPTLRWKISPPSSGSKNKPRKETSRKRVST